MPSCSSPRRMQAWKAAQTRSRPWVTSPGACSQARSFSSTSSPMGRPELRAAATSEAPSWNGWRGAGRFGCASGRVIHSGRHTKPPPTEHHGSSSSTCPAASSARSTSVLGWGRRSSRPCACVRKRTSSGFMRTRRAPKAMNGSAASVSGRRCTASTSQVSGSQPWRPASTACWVPWPRPVAESEPLRSASRRAGASPRLSTPSRKRAAARIGPDGVAAARPQADAEDLEQPEGDRRHAVRRARRAAPARDAAPARPARRTAPGAGPRPRARRTTPRCFRAGMAAAACEVSTVTKKPPS